MRTAKCKRCGARHLSRMYLPDGVTFYYVNRISGQPHYETCTGMTETDKARQRAIVERGKVESESDVRGPIESSDETERYNDLGDDEPTDEPTEETVQAGDKLISTTSGSLETLREIIRQEIANATKPKVETRKVDGRQHRLFDRIKVLVGARVNILLVGPAASGKSSVPEKVADSLGMRRFSMPMGPTRTEPNFLGYMDASGKYVRTLFREAYEHGGVFVADEMDNSNASVLTVLNGALANGNCGFPDGMVSRHADFVFVGTANTWGRGADRQYVGRQQLDAATLDRFVRVAFDYDESAEFDWASADSGELKAWVSHVQKVRKIAFDSNIRIQVTPRASITGVKLLRAGIPQDDVAEMTIWADVPADIKRQIQVRL